MCMSMKCSHKHPEVKRGRPFTKWGALDSLLKPASDVVAKAKGFPKGIHEGVADGQPIFAPMETKNWLGPATKATDTTDATTHSSPLLIISATSKTKPWRQSAKNTPVSSKIPHILAVSSSDMFFQRSWHSASSSGLSLL